MQRYQTVVDRSIANACAERGTVLVHTGNGKGKSTAAFGMLARALGHKQTVGVVQFIKGSTDTGEENFFRAFPNVSWYVAGEGFTWETQNWDRDCEMVQAGWEIATSLLINSDYHLIVLDELNIVLKLGYLPVEEVVAVLKQRPAHQNVVMTGRGAPEALTAFADTVTEMDMVKHAFYAGIKAQPGVEY